MRFFIASFPSHFEAKPNRNEFQTVQLQQHEHDVSSEIFELILLADTKNKEIKRFVTMSMQKKQRQNKKNGRPLPCIAFHLNLHSMRTCTIMSIELHHDSAYVVSGSVLISLTTILHVERVEIQ